MLTVGQLRTRAATHSLFCESSLRAAVHRLGFVQADPIRAPARAQDLILWQRVSDYRAGDLERAYATLDIEEDYLYAYGFLPSATSRLLRPRATAKKLARADHEVLATVEALSAAGQGSVHPRDLDVHFGKKRVINAWGGYSQATKRSLERLHHVGLLRVVGRKNGVRLYAPPVPSSTEPAPARTRFRGLLMVIAGVLAPLPERTLHSMAAQLRRSLPRLGSHREQVAAMLRDGLLEADECEGVRYVWPAAHGQSGSLDEERQVRLLAPFGPLVWDRTRFEQLYGWSYRFEAYTPVEKRVRGYYALPLLWRDSVVGWANASAGGSDGALSVEVGFVRSRPRERGFTRALDAEIERLARFLSPRPEGSARTQA